MKKKRKKWTPPSPRVHETRDDRARTWGGKTVNSKVRSEGRTLAAEERQAKTKQIYEAAHRASPI